MTAGYVIPVDPTDLANRFAAPEEREDTEEPKAESIFSTTTFAERIEPLLDRIPKREADLIFLYFIQKKRQADIAEIFGVTQAAVSYRLDRGLQRIKFLLAIPTITEEEMREDLPEIFKSIDVDILVGMWQTTCQSAVAASLGLTQGRVRHRFFKAVDVLKATQPEQPRFAPYAKVFSAIANKKFNICREVSLPQWSNRGRDECI